MFSCCGAGRGRPTADEAYQPVNRYSQVAAEFRVERVDNTDQSPYASTHRNLQITALPDQSGETLVSAALKRPFLKERLQVALKDAPIHLLAQGYHIVKLPMPVNCSRPRLIATLLSSVADDNALIDLYEFYSRMPELSVQVEVKH